MSKPFTDTLQFKWSTTDAVNVKQLWVNPKQVEFHYNVNGTEYRRLQQDGNAGSNRKGLKKEMVKYRIDQPEIGYLLTLSE